MARKNEVDEVQKELQTTLNEVKSFQQKRNDTQVRGFLVFPAGMHVEHNCRRERRMRLKAQNNKRRHETKLAEEKQKAAAIEEVAAVLQEDFKVGLFEHVFGVDER